MVSKRGQAVLISLHKNARPDGPCRGSVWVGSSGGYSARLISVRSEVQVLLDPPSFIGDDMGALAQLGERLICIQEVIGSIPIGSTIPPKKITPSRTSAPSLAGVFDRLIFRRCCLLP